MQPINELTQEDSDHQPERESQTSANILKRLLEIDLTQAPESVNLQMALLK